MKLFVTDRRDNLKCGGCNYQTSVFYGVGKTKEDARSNYENINPPEYGLGLCAHCVIEWIENNNLEISTRVK